MAEPFEIPGYVQLGLTDIIIKGDRSLARDYFNFEKYGPDPVVRAGSYCAEHRIGQSVIFAYGTQNLLRYNIYRRTNKPITKKLSPFFAFPAPLP